MLIKGKTIAILYAEKLDDTESRTVHVSNLDNCFVFNASLNETLFTASVLLENADKRAEKNDQICFGCEQPLRAEKKSMRLDFETQTCDKCKLFSFCRKVCCIFKDF